VTIVLSPGMSHSHLIPFGMGDVELNLQQDDHFAPVTGGVSIAKYVKRACVASVVQYDSDLDAHICRLLALYPDVNVAVRNQDLRAVDHATKLAMLDGFNWVAFGCPESMNFLPRSFNWHLRFQR